MGMKPTIETREQRSQATPLAEDILRMIQGQIDQGAFGQGFGPLQQEAGTAMRQFVNSGGGNIPQIRDVGPAGANFAEMARAMEAVQDRRVGQQAADLREGMGAAGTRYGTALQTGEGRFRAQAQDDFGVQLQQIAAMLDQAQRADTQMGINRDIAQGQFGMAGNDQLLNAITSMFGMGQANVNPAFQMAGMGIMPDNQFVSPGIGSQLMSGGFNLLSGLLPVAGQFMQNRRQGMPGGAGQFTAPSMRQFQLPTYNPQWNVGGF